MIKLDHLKIKQCKFGRGVFTTRGIKKGEQILADPLLVLGKVPNLTFAEVIDFKNNSGFYLRTLNQYVYEYKDGAALGLGLSSLINHSLSPNCDYLIIESQKAPTILVQASRDIRANSQLYIDYGYDPKVYL
jgi:uncharacterized protein